MGINALIFKPYILNTSIVDKFLKYFIYNLENVFTIIFFFEYIVFLKILYSCILFLIDILRLLDLVLSFVFNLFLCIFVRSVALC